MSEIENKLHEMAAGMENRYLVGMAHETRKIAASVAAMESQLAALKEENERLKEILLRQCTLAATIADERDTLKARVADYEEALADKRRLTRELDILLNGDSAAKQASLCDLVSQLSQYDAPILARVAELENAPA